MRHFYHCWVGGDWPRILHEHLAALGDTKDADWQVTMNLVRAGYEQETLRGLHAWAQQEEPDEPVLYAHTKGASHAGLTTELLSTVHRRSMTANLVGRWQECVQLLHDGYDAVGCHWLTPETYPGLVTIPVFGGNFWWSTAGYLADLPEVSDENRHEAEAWIGRGDPKVYDLMPGWPTLGLFALEVVEECSLPLT